MAHDDHKSVSDDKYQDHDRLKWWQKFCLRCHDPDPTPSWEPSWWKKIFPFPLFPTFRQAAQQICIIIFFFLMWGILYAEIGDPVGLNGELLSMTLLVIASYLVGWIWLKVTTLPALIGMLLTGILFQNLQLVHMTNTYRQLNQDLRKIALVIILMRAGLGLNADVLKKHYIAVLQLGLLPWLVECVAIAITSHYLLHLPWIWGFLLGSMIASVSPAVVVPCLFRLREVGYGVAKGIPTLLLAAASIDDSVSVAVFAIILNAMFSPDSTTFNIIKGPISIVVGIVLGGLWGGFLSILPEKRDTYVVPLRFLALFLGGLFALFISNLVGWSGAGPLAIVSSGFMAAYFWEKQGWPVNKNPVSNLFRILWIFFEPILFAFTGAQITLSALDPNVMSMGAICLLSCLALRVVATFLISFGCGLNAKEKLFIGLTWMAKATVQAALGPAALDLVNNGQSAGDTRLEEEYYAKTILAMSVLSVVISAPAGAVFIALTGPKLLSKEYTIFYDSVSSWDQYIMGPYCGRNIAKGIVTGGLECNLEHLLSLVYDIMIFCVGKKEVENLKNVDQIKRELRQIYPILDYLLESLDPNCVPQTSILLDFTQSLLCSQAQQLQQVLDNYAEKVTGRWACLSIHGHLVATSSDFCELDAREAKLLMLLAAAQDGAPLRETPVYLPHMSPNVAFRAVSCKLLADVYVLVICGATPALSQIDEIVLQCWENSAHIIKEAKLIHPRNFPLSVSFEPCMLGFMLVNINKKRCVFSRHLHNSNLKSRSMSGMHRMDILRTFFVTTAKDLAPELTPSNEDHDCKDELTGMSETYWCSEYHKCHAQRCGNLIACVLYAPTVPTHTMRLLTNKLLQELINNKDIFW